MSDETGDQPAPDRLFPDADPIFLDDDEPEIPEAADLPPAPETGDEAIGPPVALSSARGLKPGEFHRPPPDLSSLPSIASYQPPVIDTGDEDEAPPAPPEHQIEPAGPGDLGHRDGDTDGDDTVELSEPAGLPSARDLKPGEFHRPPPQLSSLPSVAPYQPPQLDPIDDGMADFVEQPEPPDGTNIESAAHTASQHDERPDLEEPTPAAPEGSEDAKPESPLHGPADDETRRRGFDELPVYPPVPSADAALPPSPPPQPPPGPSPPPPIHGDGAPKPIAPGPPPPPPKIRVGPPPPPPGTPAAPAATTPVEPRDTITPPPAGVGGAGLPVRDAPPAPPPIRTEIPARPPGPSRAPTAPLPVVPPPPVVAGQVARPPQEPPRRPQPELTMEDLIAASMAQSKGSDSVDWFVDAQNGRTAGQGRRIGAILAVAAVVALVLGVGAFLRHADSDTATYSGTNESALLAVDPDGTTDAPYGIGDWAEIGGGWWLSVADANVEAEAVLQDSADFNPAPRNGGYAMAGLDLRYVGTEPTTLFDLSFDAVAPSGRTHSSFDCRATEPHPLDRRVDIFAGAVVTGDECFDVAVADRAGLLLAVSSGPDSEPVHYSFAARGSSETSPPDPPPATEAAGTGSRGAPVPLGDAANVGGGWLLRVDRVTKDAERELVGANPFNEPPINGAYALAEVTAVYTGPGETDALDVRFNAVGPHNVGYSSAGCAAAESEPFPWASTVSQGGKLTGQVCFDIDPADTGELALYARGTPDAAPVFFSAGA